MKLCTCGSCSKRSVCGLLVYAIIEAPDTAGGIFRSADSVLPSFETDTAVEFTRM